MTPEKIEAIASRIAPKPFTEYPGAFLDFANAIIAQARAELIAELKPVAYRYPKSGVDNGYYYEDSLDGEEPRFKRLWQPLAVIPSTKEGHEDQ